MKKFCLFSFIVFFPPHILFPQTPGFYKKFNQAKIHLSQNETAAALPILKDLYKEDPANSNVNYLLGICYTEEESSSGKSVIHLEKSMKDVAAGYDGNSYKERRAPIFVHYYLTVAYSQNGKCAEAKRAKNYFHTLYGIEKNDYYTADAEKWVLRCKEKVEPSGADSLQNISATEIRNPASAAIVTKNIDYTYTAPLYGVQVGAFSRLVPVYEFSGLKNVEAFIDTRGTIRYVIGHFVFKQQAESLLKTVQEAGYKDAFIVDVNKEKKFSEEVIIADNVSVHNQNLRKAVFKVQIGAFRESIPNEIAAVYLKLEGIEEKTENELTIISSGKFNTYEEAEKFRMEIISLGIPDAFIVAYSENKKIDVKLARSFYQNKKN